MRPSLASDTITVLRAPTVVDRYGNDEHQWENATQTVVTGCRVDPATSEETFGPTRDMAERRWRVYCPLITDMRATDRVEALGREFDVDGPPQHYRSPRGHVGHLTAVLKEVEG